MRLERSAVQMEGREFGKLHIMRFTGTAGHGESRARKFVQLQKAAMGWRRLTAASDEDEEVDLFIDGENNKKNGANINRHQEAHGTC